MDVIGSSMHVLGTIVEHLQYRNPLELLGHGQTDSPCLTAVLPLVFAVVSCVVSDLRSGLV
jgi:hypothetical protein